METKKFDWTRYQLSREKIKSLDLSYKDDNFDLFSLNKLLKVSPGITLPEENKSLFNISESIYPDEEYEELKRDRKIQNVVDRYRTRYTISATIEKIKKVLASVKSNDLEEDNIDEREYYYQAYQFQKLRLYKREDIPAFKINLGHLPDDIIYELSTFDVNTKRFVLKQAVSRIFEDINFDLYHDSISSNVEVILVK